jgi:hypothetical protein
MLPCFLSPVHWRKVNDIIEKAMAEGEFDNLPGLGKPIDLEDYFNTPEDLRLGYKMLKENGFRPTEVELFSEIAHLRQQLANAKPADREPLQRRLMEQETHLAIMQEKNRRRR